MRFRSMISVATVALVAVVLVPTSASAATQSGGREGRYLWRNGRRRDS